MEQVVEALKQYDRKLWMAMNDLKPKPPTQQDDRPPAGLPSRSFHDRCPSQDAWKDSLRWS